MIQWIAQGVGHGFGPLHKFLFGTGFTGTEFFIDAVAAHSSPLVIGLAASAHQAWSANIFTTVSDMFPKKATASVTGIGGMAGGMGGIVLTWAVQKNLFVHYRAIGQIEKAYFIMFLICGAAYLTAWLVMHVLAPKMSKVRL